MYTRIILKIETKLTNVLKNIKDKITNKIVSFNDRLNIKTTIQPNNSQTCPREKKATGAGQVKTFRTEHLSLNPTKHNRSVTQSKKDRENKNKIKRHKTSPIACQYKQNKLNSYTSQSKLQEKPKGSENVLENSTNKINAYTNTNITTSQIQHIKKNHNLISLEAIQKEIHKILTNIIPILDNIYKMTDQRTKDFLSSMNAIRLAENANKAEAINLQQKHDAISKEFLANSNHNPNVYNKTGDPQTEEASKPSQRDNTNATQRKPRQYIRRRNIVSESNIEQENQTTENQTENPENTPLGTTSATKRKAKTGLKGTNTDKKGKTGLEVHSDNELNLESKKKSNKKK